MLIRSAPFHAGFLPEHPFHLFARQSQPGSKSFIFVPGGPEPGLSVDFIRLDVFDLPGLTPETVANLQLAPQRAYGGASYFRHRILSKTVEAILFEHRLEVHPVAGSEHALCRVERTADGGLFSLTLTRKIEPLAEEAVAQRLDWLTAAQIDHAGLAEANPEDDPLPSACAAANDALEAKLDTLQGQELTEETLDDFLDRIEALLISAGPVYTSAAQVQAAGMVVGAGLSGGDTARFPRLERIAGLCALALDDQDASAPNSPLHAPFFDMLEHLSELMICRAGPQHRDRIRRAGTIWSMQASNLADSDPKRAARCAIRSAFARAFWFQHLDARIDDIGPTVEAALSDAGLVRAMNTSLYQLCETLMACSDRKAAIEATKALLMTGKRPPDLDQRDRAGRALSLGSCLAADLAHAITERAAAQGAFKGELMGAGGVWQEHMENTYWQIKAQTAHYGMTTDILDGLRTASHAGGLPVDAERPMLFYIRPLFTSRRLLVPNRVEIGDRSHILTSHVLPDEITLEAALMIGLSPPYAADALGGPVDIFGMGRASVHAEVPDKWQLVAGQKLALASLICVLPDDTAGLGWELNQIRRNGYQAKTLLVVPPDREGAARIEPDAVRKLHENGLSAPGDMEPGFALFAAGGGVEAVFSFDDLWTGRLRAELELLRST